jgi:hypothetical protein
LNALVAERLTAKPALAKAKPSGRAGPYDIIKARLIAESAKEVSQPDNSLLLLVPQRIILSCVSG